MSLVFKTRVFAEGKKKSNIFKNLGNNIKSGANKVVKLPSKGAHKLFDLAEGKKAGSGKFALGAAGAVLGGGAGAGVARITLRGLKGRLREANPTWSDEKVQAEYDKIKKKRLAIGAALGAVAGGGLGAYKGVQYGKRNK